MSDQCCGTCRFYDPDRLIKRPTSIPTRTDGSGTFVVEATIEQGYCRAEPVMPEGRFIPASSSLRSASMRPHDGKTCQAWEGLKA